MSQTKLIILVLCLLLSACAGTSQDKTLNSQISSDQDSGRATSSLLAKVDIQESSEQWERAAALLERALRIEPRNAYLWHRLAQIRLQQGQYRLAESLIQKSNALAKNDEELQKKNSRLLRQAQSLM